MPAVSNQWKQYRRRKKKKTYKANLKNDPTKTNNNKNPTTLKRVGVTSSYIQWLVPFPLCPRP